MCDFNNKLIVKKTATEQRWSPCRDSNPRPPLYQRGALPTELHGQLKNSHLWREKSTNARVISFCRTRSYIRGFSLCCWWAEQDSNLRRRKPADLQSAPVGHFGIDPCRSLVCLSVRVVLTLGIIGQVPYSVKSTCKLSKFRIPKRSLIVLSGKIQAIFQGL